MMRTLTILISILFCCMPSVAFSKDLTATEIVEKANKLMNQEKVAAKVKMTIVTTSGNTREFFFDSWSMDYGEKNLIRYTGPRRVKDQAMLLLNNADDIWSYFPRTNRVRKLATHAKKQKMQGSDFCYEDMGAGDSFLTDFEHRLMKAEEKEKHDCHVIELTRKEGVDSNYSRLVLWVDRENSVTWSIDYYDEKDESLKLKTLVMSDMEIIQGIPTPFKMVMYNHLDGTSTVQELIEIDYNPELEDQMFTERGLRK